jgi:hypothetical protein
VHTSRQFRGTAESPTGRSAGQSLRFIDDDVGRVIIVAHFSVPRLTQLDKQWQELISLCAKEKEFRAENRHLKLVRVISERIEQLAAEMGFSDRLIQRREFRAEKNGDHISRIITG